WPLTRSRVRTAAGRPPPSARIEAERARPALGLEIRLDEPQPRAIQAAEALFADADSVRTDAQIRQLEADNIRAALKVADGKVSERVFANEVIRPAAAAGASSRSWRGRSTSRSPATSARSPCSVGGSAPARRTSAPRSIASPGP